MKTVTHPGTAPFGVAIALGFLTLLGPTSIDMYLPSLPVMANELGTNYTTMQFTLTVFLLAMGGGQLIFGPIIDALGRRGPLLTAIIIFVFTSVWSAWASTHESLIIARFFQGLAASLAIVTAMSSVRDVAEGARATQIFALLMTVQGLGPVFAPAIGGLIGEAFGWRAIFLTLAALGILVLISSLIMLPESLPAEKRTKLEFGVIFRTYTELLSDPKFLVPATALTLTFVFLFVYIGGSAFAYQEHYGLSPSHFGLVFGGTGFAVLLGAMLSARFAIHMAVQKLALIGSLAIFIGTSIALTASMTPMGFYGIVIGMFVSLAGLGIAESTLMSIALATRNKALGSSAAILGALPLMLGAAATPLAAFLVQQSSIWWLLCMVLIAVTCLLFCIMTVKLAGAPNR